MLTCPSRRRIPLTALTALTILAARAAALGSDIDYYIDDDAPSGGNGLSWPTAFNSLDDAVALAQFGDRFHIAQGTYVPGNPATIPPLTFVIPQNTTVLGGYAGYDAPDPDLRDPVAFPTILSGDVNGDDGPGFTNRTDNLSSVIQVRLQSTLDGLVITGAWGASNLSSGNVVEAAVVIRNCRFRGNSAAAGGALVVLADSNVFFENCVFEENQAVWDGVPGSTTGVGGAVYIVDDTTYFVGCRFSRNRALLGGALGTLSGSPDVRCFNCIFTANEAGGLAGVAAGGAIGFAFFSGSNKDVNLEQCLVYGNTSPNGICGGIYTNNRRIDLRNTVLWANRDAYGHGFYAQLRQPQGFLITDIDVANLIEGAAPDALPGPPAPAWALGREPTFMDPLGPDGILGTDDDDFRPAYGSPAIDAGGPQVSPGLPADKRGLPRSVDDPATPNVHYPTFTGLLDIGPYEYQEDCDGNGVVDSLDIKNGTLADCDGNGVPDVCEAYEDCNGNGENDRCDIGTGAAQDCNGNGVPDSCDIASGFSDDADGNGVPDGCEPAVLTVQLESKSRGAGPWANPYQDLQAALAAARARHAPTEIWVTEGVYHPTEPNGSILRSFEIPPGVTLRGGFTGTETSGEQADPVAYPTLLSGDLNGNDDPNNPTTWDDNAISVVSAGSAPGAILDGLGISGGFARTLEGPQPGLQPDGAALRVADGDLTLRHCAVTHNHVGGGSVVSLTDQGALNLDHCTVTENSTIGEGGFLVSEHAWRGAWSVGVAGYPPEPPSLAITDSMIAHNHVLDPGASGTLLNLFMTSLRMERTLVSANGFPSIIDSVVRLPLSAPVHVRLANSAIVGNTGQAMLAHHISPVIHERILVLRNATIAGNGAGLVASGMAADMQNTILYNNGGNTFDNIFLGPDSLVRYNTVEGWDPADNNGANIVGNFADDPMFMDPIGPDAMPGTGDENFRLMPGSTSIDSGDSIVALGPPNLDLDGNPRFVDDPDAPNTGPMAPFPSPVDRGAYERQVPRGPRLPGDITGEGTVDVLDFAILAANFGTVDTPGVPGDLNADGCVDVRDFAILAAAWR